MKTIMTMLSVVFLFQLSAHQYDDVNKKWKSPTPWIHDRFSDFLDHMPKNAIAIEVGVQGGGFAAFMLRKTNPEKLYLVDCWCHQQQDIYDDEANVSDREQIALYKEVKRRFKGDRRVKIIRKFSNEAVNMFPDEYFDWVYIDANHSYEASREDIALWWPKVKKGGILSGHDYADRPDFGVVRAVNEFLISHNLYFTYLTEELEHIYDSWAVRKPTN